MSKTVDTVFQFAPDERVDELHQQSLDVLSRAAKELKLRHRGEGDSQLAMGRVLCEVLDRPMSVWDVPPSKLPNGALQRLASWARRQVPGLTYGRVAQLTRAHRVFTCVKTVGVEPANEGQLRPLTRLLAGHADRIPEVWERACARAKHADGPTMSEVAQAARETVPEAFPKKPKRKPSAKKTVERLLREGYTVEVLEAALREIAKENK